uniref:YcbK family protein n=1 Tax=Pararhizobium sp. IMCC3301 TaxID=3067904 RepID=UPI002740849A|nr:DUF882 domain-containing protein [Pararhizobium sp. IMCC3301]
MKNSLHTQSGGPTAHPPANSSASSAFPGSAGGRLFASRVPKPANLQRIVMVLAIILLALALVGCASYSASRVNYPNATVTYSDTKWCVPRRLKRVLQEVAGQFGNVSVTSTKRWWLENWLKGGARKSWHRKCKATDFSVRANPDQVVRFLKSHPDVGGYKYYPAGFYHIDVGPRRTW